MRGFGHHCQDILLLLVNFNDAGAGADATFQVDSADDVRGSQALGLGNVRIAARSLTF